jgi:hypothetical protein
MFLKTQALTISNLLQIMFLVEVLCCPAVGTILALGSTGKTTNLLLVRDDVTALRFLAKHFELKLLPCSAAGCFVGRISVTLGLRAFQFDKMPPATRTLGVGEWKAYQKLISGEIRT